MWVELFKMCPYLDHMSAFNNWTILILNLDIYDWFVATQYADHLDICW